MRLDEKLSAEAAKWLRRAQSNLARARQAKPDSVVWEDLCFDAQQAAEKAIKAVLTRRGVDFPKSHNIGVLLDLLPPSEIPDGVWAASALTDYAVETRYPGPSEPLTDDDHRYAVELAERVVSWAEALVR